jgi:Zn-dependent protease with chaperone function
VVLFTRLGVEPAGRIATGIIELMASILILWRRTTWLGALLGIGLMLGAIASHLFVIGIESAGDGGQLFAMAWLVLVLCIFLLYAYRKDSVLWKKYVPFVNS